MRRWPITRRMRSAYGREARMRSCALRILLAATISMALVIFCVLLKLAILTRISFTPGMSLSVAVDRYVPASISARLGEFFAALLQRRFVLRREHRVRVDAVDGLLVVGLGERLQTRFEGADLLQLDLVHVAVVHGVDGQRHFGHRHRRVLLLLHQLGHALAALELTAGRLVEVRSELRERRELAILRERQTNTAAELGDDLGLRRTTDARHRDTGVHGRADTGVEQVAFQEDLAVGDG